MYQYMYRYMYRCMYQYIPYHASSRSRTAVIGRGSEEACFRSRAAHTHLWQPSTERIDVARVDSIAGHSKQMRRQAPAGVRGGE